MQFCQQIYFLFQVRITDSALTLAAKLSARYITGRFLPDKAIDVMDEACATVRVELDSSPAALESVQRRILQLEIEARALEREAKTDAVAKERAEGVLKVAPVLLNIVMTLMLVCVEFCQELNDLQEKELVMEGEVRRSREVLQSMAATKREIEETLWAIEENERR